jgi:glycosyltransferase involved in cell wall biosynthesis
MHPRHVNAGGSGVVAVSVITPAWNAAAFLTETLDSVLGQTFTDWEMLVVDDGSSDETPHIVASYARRDARIRLLRQANAGPSAARNHAMREARGRFFAFLDSDDRWAPTFLAAQLEVFERYPDTGLVTANGYFLGGPFDGQSTRPLAAGYPILPLTELIANESAVFIMTVFRREVFETIGGFDERQWRSEDYDFWLRAATAGFRFRRNPAPLGWYRVRGNSLSRDRVRMIAGILDTFGKVRPRCAADRAACAALDAQVTRFERELLLEEAKAALEHGNSALAAERLGLLRARGGGLLVGIMRWLAAHLPAAAVLAYRLRGWRRTRPGRRPGSRVAAGKEAAA